jgi:hypothetical protein
MGASEIAADAKDVELNIICRDAMMGPAGE